MEKDTQLTLIQTDIIKELINIGVGRAAAIINKMAGFHLTLTVPEVILFDMENFMENQSDFLREQVSAVNLSFEGEFTGMAALVFPPDSASNLIASIIQGEKLILDQDSLRIGTLQEVGNIVLSGVMSVITNIVKKHLHYFPPEYREGILKDVVYLEKQTKESKILLVKTQFYLENRMFSGDILIIFRMFSFQAFLKSLDELYPLSETKID